MAKIMMKDPKKIVHHPQRPIRIHQFSWQLKGEIFTTLAQHFRKKNHML